ncbi:aminomethyl-transferring glycine dehydrogenase subunit GcvPA [bacterium]|nr:aminomethyl-transferring glycine dehydrogenase subunit GcvPA [bacterium]
MPFLPMTDRNYRKMLQTIGVSDFEELLQAIPEGLRHKGKLNLKEPLSEMEVTRLLEEMASQNENASTHLCFLGGGAYDHFIPAAVGHIVSRSEFYTSYTPYQPEVSQGTLQAIYEYQTMIARLTGMDVANASLYDGASAMAEAALLLQAHTGRRDILISKSVHPYYRRVVRTYCHRAGIVLKEIGIKGGVTDLEMLSGETGPETAGLLVQHPNFFGNLEPVEDAGERIHQAGGLFAVSVDPVSLGVLKPPGEYGADVATGEGQALGNVLNFGGPYLGIFAVKQAFVRRMPGRLVGVTRDAQNRRGFVLTLQTREQHIRREKATSSICTNEQLCALAATVYMALMGKEGFPRVANLCLQKAHYLADRLAKIKGVKPAFTAPFFKEFVVQTPMRPDVLIREMRKQRIFAGIDLSRFDYGMERALLVAVTEKRTRQDMDRYIEVMETVLRK